MINLVSECLTCEMCLGGLETALHSAGLTVKLPAFTSELSSLEEQSFRRYTFNVMYVNSNIFF